jgi:hypothetical protein
MRRPLIGREDFQASIGQREQAQGKVMGGLPNEWGVFFLTLGGTKEEKECVKEDISSYV